MQIKPLFLILVFLTFLSGIPAQSQSADEKKAGPDIQEELSLIGITSLSDRQGVDFGPYLAALKKTTQATWQKFSSSEATANHRRGVVIVRFKILPNGQIMNGSIALEGRSGSTSVDRAAWGVLINSKYPPLPSEFQGPYLELRTKFSHNLPPEM